jgi:hypothetical protein
VTMQAGEMSWSSGLQWVKVKTRGASTPHRVEVGAEKGLNLIFLALLTDSWVSSVRGAAGSGR